MNTGPNVASPRSSQAARALDATSDAAFERVARLASRSLSAPVALLTVLDEQGPSLQGYLGLDERSASLLSIALCQPIVATGEDLVVRDAREHALLSTLPLIASRTCVSCAGVPLRASNGRVWGALCVVTHEPRLWSRDDLASLRDLADVAMTEIELRAGARALQQSESRYRSLVRHIPNGAVFLVDREQRHLVAEGEQLESISGSSRQELEGHLLSETSTRSGSLAQLASLLRGALQGHSEVVEFERDAQSFAIHTSPITNEAGEIDLGMAFSYNVTAGKRLEDDLRSHAVLLWSILDNMHEGVIVSDAAGKVILYNSAAQALSSRAVGDDPFADWPNNLRVFGADGSTPLSTDETPFARALRGEQVDQADVLLSTQTHPEGRWLSVSTAPLNGSEGGLQGGICVVRDVTTSKQAEQALAIRTAYVHLLSRVSTEVNKASSSHVAFSTCLGLLGAHGDFAFAHLFLLDEPSGRLRSTDIWWTPTQDGVSSPPTEVLSLSIGPGEGLAGRALRTGEACWTEDATVDPAFLMPALALDVGVHGAVAFPVWVGTEVVAVMEFFSRRVSSPSPHLLDVMASVGLQLGRVIERERHAAHIEALSVTDELTGLSNRRGFVAQVTRLLQIAEQDERPALLFFADLDGLKRINDSFGHQAGDEAICEAAEVLRTSFRATDVIARLGGDEFVIFAPDARPDDGPALLARISSYLERTNAAPHRRYHLAMSTGVTSYDPRSPETIEQLLARADALMYARKQAGTTLIPAAS